MLEQVRLFSPTLRNVGAIVVSAVLLHTSAAVVKGQIRKVMWEPVKIEERDLLAGPGGALRPDLRRISYIRKEHGGHNRKYRIRDASDRVWVAKIGREAKPETVAVRLLWGIGYKTEINYYYDRMTIPKAGTFDRVRLEARPDNVMRIGHWKWNSNPFDGTDELEGLKIMMVLMKNWDVENGQNQQLLVTVGERSEVQYVISDLGATFGKLGNNNLPFIFRLGRSVGNPEDYAKTDLVRRDNGRTIDLSYKGKNRKLFKKIRKRSAIWLYGLLSRLSDKQIRDAFRAAHYNPSEIELFVRGFKEKVEELGRLKES